MRLCQNYKDKTVQQIERFYHTVNNRYKISWQGWQFWNRIFDEELGKVDVAEVRMLLDEKEPEATDE